MKDAITKLIRVKSIVTLLICLVFCILALCKVIPVDQFVEIFKIIIIFYFGSQVGKKEASIDGKD